MLSMGTLMLTVIICLSGQKFWSSKENVCCTKRKCARPIKNLYKKIHIEIKKKIIYQHKTFYSSFKVCKD